MVAYYGMGLFDTPKEKRKQYMHVTAKGTAWDIHNIEEIHRKRGQRVALITLMAICFLLGFALINYKISIKWGTILIVIGVILAFASFPIFQFLKKARKQTKRNVKKEISKRNEWERIDKLPSWAVRKMRRRRKNKVNGEHYVYKKERGKFYKKKK